MLLSNPWKKIFLHVLSPYIKALPEKAMILDIRCGPGELTGSVVKQLKCPGLVGMDIEPDFVSIASAGAKGTVEIILYDGYRFPFRNEAFSLAYCHEVIEHVQNDEPFLSECCRILKTGALFALSTPNGAKKPWDKKVNPDHYCHYTKAEIYSKLESAGFHPLNCYWRGHALVESLFCPLFAYLQALRQIPLHFLISRPTVFHRLLQRYSRQFSSRLISRVLKYSLVAWCLILAYKLTIEPALILIDKGIALVVDPLFRAEFDQNKERVETEDMIVICRR